MENNIYYATATNDKGVSVIIRNLSNEWVLANNEAREYCKKNNLFFESVRPYKYKENKNSVMTKAFKQRKRMRGKKGYKESKFFFED